SIVQAYAAASAHIPGHGLSAAIREVATIDSFHKDGSGSNGWVIGGGRTSSGKPLLANDPHLMAGIPSTWYLAHVVGAELDVIGATLPGLPGVVIGRNQS